MIKVGIGATTEVDRHNCKIPKEVLEKMVDDINRGTYAVGVGMEHDLTILPIGKIVKSELISLENGEHAAIMYAGIFEKFVPLIGPGGTTLYFAENKKDARPFADTKHENIDVLTIGIDPVNFDEDKFIEVQEYLQKDCELQVQTVMRKSSIPDPEVMIYLISGSLITLVGGKVLDKVLDMTAEAIVNKIKAAISKISLSFKKNNTLTTYVVREYMTRENNSYIVELCVKTKLPNTFFDALQSEKLAKIYEKIDNVGNAYFRNNIAKVQLLYNEKQEEWELNYFTSKDGKVLGTEACYEETIVLYDKVTENGIVQNSIAENAFMENEE